MSFVRYPGGKGKLQKEIIHRLQDMADVDHEYREPFYGGGGVGIDYLSAKLLSNSQKPTGAWINDKDIGIACLHTAVIRYPEMLSRHIRDYLGDSWDYDDQELPEDQRDATQQARRIQLAQGFRALQDEFKSWTKMPTRDSDIVDYGLKKLVLHQMSYSGLGAKSGGPLGGMKQESKYPIDCRWSPKHMTKKIYAIHDLYSKFEMREDSCTNRDFADLVLDNTKSAVIYLDPPYYDKGGDLYYHAFTKEIHIRLRDALLECKHPFLLSYDACDEVRDLYDYKKFCVKRIPVKCSITATKKDENGNIRKDENGNELKRRPLTKDEFLIVPRDFCHVISDLEDPKDLNPKQTELQ